MTKAELSSYGPNFRIERTDTLQTKSHRITEVATAYNETLPRVNPACRTIVTIPAYKEFKYGQIRGALKDLDNQTMDKKKYEVILLVNNASVEQFPEEAEARKDNQELLSYVAEEQARGRLSNVRVVACIDGELPPRHQGINRGLANEIAEIRFRDTTVQGEGVIVLGDADIAIAPTFLDELMEEYDADPSLESTYIARMPYPIDYVSDDLYVGFAHEFMQNVYHRFLSEHENIKGSGPTLAFRAKLQHHPELRIYMGGIAIEDIILGGLLPGNSKFRILPQPRIYVADRIRSEGYESEDRHLYTPAEINPVSSLHWTLNQIIDSLCDSDTFVSTSKLIPPTEIWQRIPIEAVIRNIIDIVAKVSQRRARALRTYMMEEIKEANTRMDSSKTDIRNILTGAMMFSLARLMLDVYQ